MRHGAKLRRRRPFSGFALFGFGYLAAGLGAPTVKRWGGRIPLVVGSWFIAVAIFAGTFSPLFEV